MKTFAFLLILITTQGQAWQQTDISINADGHTIHGSLSKPENSDTVVLIIAGSGPTDRDGNQAQIKTNTYLILAQALYEQGYATVRYDKRGIAASAEPPIIMKDMRFGRYVDDAALWVDKLSKEFKHVVLVGHSIGGLMALQVAQKKPVKSVITLAGMASSGHDTLVRQLSEQSEFVKGSALPLLERLSKGEDIPESDVPPFLFSLFHPNLQGFVKSFLHIEPQFELSQVKQAVLVIIGDTDFQVTVNESEHMVSGNKHAKLLTIKGMNHVLKTAPAERMANVATYNNPELPLHEALMPSIIAFLKQ